MKTKTAAAATPGRRKRRRDHPERLPAAEAVDQRRLLQRLRQLAEIGVHHPHRQRQRHEGVGEDQADPRVVETPGPKQQEDRQDDGDRRQEALGEHPEGEMAAAGVEAREAVGHHRAHHGRQHGRGRGDDEAVDEPLEAAIGEQRGGVVHDRGLRREPDRRRRQIVAARLDRGDDDPVERHENEHDEEADRQTTRRPRGGSRPRGS